MFALTPSARRRRIALLFLMIITLEVSPSRWARGQANRLPPTQPSNPSGLPNDPRVNRQPRAGSVSQMQRQPSTQPTLPRGVGGDPFRVADPLQIKTANGQVISHNNCAACHATPPITQIAESAQSGFDGTTLPTQSWANWWEVNRERYLLAARSAQPDAIQPLTAPPAVVQALLAAIQSKDNAVRAEAILSLGMIREPKAMPELQKLTKDADDACALRAWAAIGLIGDADSMRFLRTAPAPKGRDRIGWTLAVGLLEQPADSMWGILRKQTIDAQCSQEARRLAVWALRTHNPPGTHELLNQIIWNSPDPMVVCEAMLGLPVEPDKSDIAFLTNVISSIGETMNLPIMARTGVNPRGVRSSSGSDSSGGWAKAVETDSPITSDSLSSEIYPRLRESASMALAQYDNPGDSARAIIGGPLDRMAATSGAFGHAMPSDVLILGSMGNMADYSTIEDRLEFRAPASEAGQAWAAPSVVNRQADTFRNVPSRGYAAIAIGLLLSGAGTKPQNIPVAPPQPRPMPPSPDEALFSHLQQHTEPVDLRAACALALGIGGQRHRAADVKRVVDALRPGDEAVFGYTMLALSMWHDYQVLDYCIRQLGPGQQRIDSADLVSRHLSRKAPAMKLSEIMARRAITQALAVLGNPKAMPMLIKQWGQHPAADLEIARAIAWCSRSVVDSSGVPRDDLAAGFGRALAEIASQERAPALAASAAGSLGILYERGTTKRLDRLIANASFTRKGFLASSKRGAAADWAAPQRHVLALANRYYYLMANESPQAARPRP